MRTQAIEKTAPNTVALIAGPLVLMRLLEQDADIKLNKQSLMTAQQVSAKEWQIKQAGRFIKFRAFADIHQEKYCYYHQLSIDS